MFCGRQIAGEPPAIGKARRIAAEIKHEPPPSSAPLPRYAGCGCTPPAARPPFPAGRWSCRISAAVQAGVISTRKPRLPVRSRMVDVPKLDQGSPSAEDAGPIRFCYRSCNPVRGPQKRRGWCLSFHPVSLPDRRILAEPSGDHLVQGAIFLHRADHRIDLVLEIGVPLAEADRNALADRDRLADDDDL